MKPQTGTQNWLKPSNRQTIIDPRHSALEFGSFDPEFSELTTREPSLDAFSKQLGMSRRSRVKEVFPKLWPMWYSTTPQLKKPDANS